MAVRTLSLDWKALQALQSLHIVSESTLQESLRIFSGFTLGVKGFGLTEVR